MIGSSGGMGPRSLQGLAVEHDGKVFDPHIARRLLHFLSPHRGRMTLAILFMVCSTAFSLLAPYLMKVAIDRDIGAGDLRGLAWTSGYLVLVFVGNFLAEMGQRYELSWVGQKVADKDRSQVAGCPMPDRAGPRTDVPVYSDLHEVGTRRLNAVEQTMNRIASVILPR